jgi:hypothetical protein
MRDLHDEEEEDDDDEGKAEGCYAEVRQAGLLIYNRGNCLCYTACAVVYQFSPKVDKVCRHTARNFENEEKEKGKVWRLNHII